MGRRLILLLGLVILLAVVAVVVLMQGGSDGDTDADGTPGATAGEDNGPVINDQGNDGGTGFTGDVGTLVEIVIATNNLTRGMTIPEDGVGLGLWPQDALPPGAYYMGDELDRVVGGIARTDIVIGAPILRAHVVNSPEQLASVGSDAAAILNQEPPGTVALSIPLDPSGVGQVAYGIQDGDRVDVILSFLFVDVDPEFQTRLPNNYSFITRVATGELVIGAPRPGRWEPISISPEGVLIGPSEDAQRPRLLTQRTVTNALVVHVGHFDESGRLFGNTPTPVEVEATLPPPPGEETQQQAQQEETPPPSPTAYQPVIITLGVSPQDALVLTWAVDAQIPITLALRQAGDLTEVPQPSPVTLEYMITRFDAPPPPLLNYTVEPAITSVRRFDLDTLYDFLLQTLNE